MGSDVGQHRKAMIANIRFAGALATAFALALTHAYACTAISYLHTDGTLTVPSRRNYVTAKDPPAQALRAALTLALVLLTAAVRRRFRAALPLHDKVPPL
jgi:hypothetical protein